MGTVALPGCAARRPDGGVGCLGGWRVGARHGASSFRHLRSGLLRLARRRLPTSSGDADLATAVYLVAGMQERFFLKNASRWAAARAKQVQTLSWPSGPGPMATRSGGKSCR